MQREYNAKMRDGNSLLYRIINVWDRRGERLTCVPVRIAKELVASGAYFVVTTEDIALV